MTKLATVPDVVMRARCSGGTSGDPIYRMVAGVLTDVGAGGLLLDVGCGRGELRQYVGERFADYHGADVVRYDDFPTDTPFTAVDLDSGRVPLPDGFADAVAAVETVEHLENPRAFFRELTRLVRPEGRLVVSTPNQLSLLSKLTLVCRNEFNAFRSGSYPAHLTALLEVDLRRIATECGWADVRVHYSKYGRIPGTARHWPRWMSRSWPRAFSDNIVVIGRRTSP